MTAAQIGSIALALGALGVLLLGMAALLRASAASRAERALADALERRMAALEAARTRTAPDDGAGTQQVARGRERIERMLSRLAAAGMRLLDTGFGKHIVAEEDRRLLEQCGYVDARTRGLFLSARLVCGSRCRCCSQYWRAAE